MNETTTQILWFHLQRLNRKSAVKKVAFAAEVRAATERRHPGVQIVKWSDNPDATVRQANDLQTLQSHWRGTPEQHKRGDHAMPADLVLPVLDAIASLWGQDEHDAVWNDLAAQGGGWFARATKGAPCVVDAARLMRESADAVQAIASALADGRLDPAEIANALTELKQSAAAHAGLIAALEQSLARATERTASHPMTGRPN